MPKILTPPPTLADLPDVFGAREAAAGARLAARVNDAGQVEWTPARTSTGAGGGPADIWADLAAPAALATPVDAVTLDGLVWVKGTTAGSAAQSLRKYDPVSNSWTDTAVQQWGRLMAIGGALYTSPDVQNGAATDGEVLRWDDATTAWVTKGAPAGWTFADNRLTNKPVTVGPRAYLELSFPYPSHWWISYDPVGHRVTELTPPSVGLNRAAMVAVEGRVFAFGGEDAPGGDLNAIVSEYDPISDTWSVDERTRMPAARGFASAVYIGGLVYVMGGEATKGGISESNNWVYDPAVDEWSTAADITTATVGGEHGHDSHAAAVLNGRVHIIGGAGTTTHHHAYG